MIWKIDHTLQSVQNPFIIHLFIHLFIMQQVYQLPLVMPGAQIPW